MRTNNGGVMRCPKCDTACRRDTVNTGVGLVYGPYECECGWSENPEFDASEGLPPSQEEAVKLAALWLRKVRLNVESILENLVSASKEEQGETNEDS